MVSTLTGTGGVFVVILNTGVLAYMKELKVVPVKYSRREFKLDTQVSLFMFMYKPYYNCVQVPHI